MRKTIFIKLLVLCFIGLIYLPFFDANVKADSIEQEIIVEGVEEGKTYETPNIKFFIRKPNSIYTYKIVLVDENNTEYNFEIKNSKKMISLLIDKDGNLVSENPEIIINDLTAYEFNDGNIILNNSSDKKFSINNGIVSVDGNLFDYSNLFDDIVDEENLVIKSDGIYANNEKIDVEGIKSFELKKIKSFCLEKSETTKIVSATLNGEKLNTNTTLKSKIFANGKYELVITDSEGNVKTVNFTLKNKTYIAEVFEVLLKGTGNSLIIFAFTLLFGIPLGLLGCVLKKVSVNPFNFIKSDNKVLNKIKKFNPLKFILDIYTWVIRGTPLLLQLFVVYFGLPLMFGKSFALSPMKAAIITFIINYAAYFIEIFRGGMESINRGQFSSCYVLGMSKTQTYMRIIIPQTVKKVLPSITNEAITLVKDTALASVVTVQDIMFYTKQKVSHDFRLDAYLMAAIIYLVFSFVIVMVFTRIEKKYSYYN